jgi:branched-chain amino acid transport system substrate-binding protein
MTYARHRRHFLKLSAAGLALGAHPALMRQAWAQDSGPIMLGALSPLSGSGAQYGPPMQKAIAAVVNEVNAAGGVMGRQIKLVTEDCQTSPEAAVRAARKLIDVDKVVAIIGLWSSPVTQAVAPLCWESKTVVACASGADNLTHLPHQGYLFRTQPTTTLQGRKFGEFALSQGAKKIVYLSLQTPFVQSMSENMGKALAVAGGSITTVVYEDKKATYRTEVDKALAGKPDMLVLGGYVADTSVLVKEIYRADYGGKMVAFAYAVNKQLIDSVPKETVEGIFTLAPSPAEDSTTYARLKKVLGTDNPDPYTSQAYDHANLVIMAMAQAKQASGAAIKDAVRKVVADGGKPVDNAVDGIKAIAAGQAVAYQGASGPCKFTPIGDVADASFRYEQVRAGKQVLLKIA